MTTVRPLDDFGHRVPGARKDYFRRLEDSLVDVKSILKLKWERLYQKAPSEVAQTSLSRWRAVLNQYFLALPPQLPLNRFPVSTVRTALLKILRGELTTVPTFEDIGHQLYGANLPAWFCPDGLQVIADTYDKIKHRRSLAQYTVHLDDGYYVIERKVGNTIKRCALSPMASDATRFLLDTLFPNETEDEDRKREPCLPFAVLQIDDKPTLCVIKGTLTAPIQVFDTREDAEQALQELEAAYRAKDENNALYVRFRDLQAEVQHFRPRRVRPRRGPERLPEGVAPESLLSEYIPLYGVQFGNYVSHRERHVHCQEAYTAFCDLAECIGSPPSACALVGLGRRPLALAFGARGWPGSNAHYEPKEHVINLTREKGAGSLAHEWLHALDATHKVFYELEALFEALKVNTQVVHRSCALDSALGKREPYYSSPHEILARAFEVYVKDRLEAKGIVNDYLVAFLSPEDAQARLIPMFVYPYLLPEEVRHPAVQAAFGRLIAAFQGHTRSQRQQDDHALAP
ncbi:MAG: hypothetical protein KatS3mg082_1392 [Nitrospiraceae bacterium]|nr:MAG: hypothetical protein KatS3mg082_1392 [Nitrospiraceae bacterium]